MWGEGGRVGCGTSYIQVELPAAVPTFVAPCEDRGCKIVWPEPYAKVISVPALIFRLLLLIFRLRSVMRELFALPDPRAELAKRPTPELLNRASTHKSVVFEQSIYLASFLGYFLVASCFVILFPS